MPEKGSNSNATKSQTTTLVNNLTKTLFKYYIPKCKIYTSADVDYSTVCQKL